jgi:exosortase
MPVMACSVAGALLFQFLGNSTHGYIASDSLFYWWGYQWVNPESETEHAWLVLALSLFLFRRSLARDHSGYCERPIGPSIAALAGLGLHTMGFVAQQPRISILGLLAYVGGMLGLFGGQRWSRASLFPLAFMVFAIPVNALDTVGFWLQMAVVQAGERIAHAAGIAVVRNGTQLFGPDGRYQYDVVAACSGIRSLMALMALSLFIAYIWFKPFWVRAVVFLSSIPLVVLGNVVRITAIVFSAQYWGQKWGDRVHDVLGFGVFAIVLGGVIGAAEGIARLKPEWTSPNTPMPSGVGRPGGAHIRVLSLVVVAAVIGDAEFLFHRSSVPSDGKPGVVLSSDGANPAELPTYLGSEWMGRRVEPAAIEREILPPDTGFSRKLYVNLEDPSRQVLLSIVLSGRDRTSIHRPELCLVGQGWTIDGSSTHRFRYAAQPGGGFDATVLSVHREVASAGGRISVPEVVVYWFVGDDRVVASQGARMLSDAWSRIARGRAPRWAYVFLQTGAKEGIDSSLGRIQAVLDSALPIFQPPSGR